MPEFDPLGHETPPADLEALADLARQETCRSNIAVEIGTWAGRTAMVLARFLDVFCVDTWEGNPDDRLGDLATLYGPRHAFQTFCRNVGESFLVDIFPCVGRSKTWAAIWPRPAALIFIDASHRYEDVRDDILAWKPHVAPGGFLIVHDYGVPEFPGVTQAVHELMPGFQRAGSSLAYIKVPS